MAIFYWSITPLFLPYLHCFDKKSFFSLLISTVKNVRQKIICRSYSQPLLLMHLFLYHIRLPEKLFIFDMFGKTLNSERK